MLRFSLITLLILLQKVSVRLSAEKCQSPSCQFRLWSYQILYLKILIKLKCLKVLQIHANFFSNSVEFNDVICLHLHYHNEFFLLSSNIKLLQKGADVDCSVISYFPALSYLGLIFVSIKRLLRRAVT